MTDSPNVNKKPQLQTSQQSFKKSPNNSPRMKPAAIDSPGRRDTQISLKFIPSNQDVGNDSAKNQQYTSDFGQRIE